MAKKKNPIKNYKKDDRVVISKETIERLNQIMAPSVISNFLDSAHGEDDETVAPTNIENIEMSEEGKITQIEYNISIVEFAVYNSFLFSARKKKCDGIKTESYGQVSNIGLISYGGQYRPTEPWWFKLAKTKELGTNITIQTTKAKNSYGEIICSLNIIIEGGVSADEMSIFYSLFKKLAFNNSEYRGKCLKIAVREGSFDSIEIIEVEDNIKNIVLNDVQKRYMEHFRAIVGRGGNARYLFNGVPGSGKTEIIRKLITQLTPDSTFIIPIFESVKDLTTIMESAEIFDKGVVIMDDIDLYLGNRDNGSATRFLGEFLSFFDGVKKRKINLLASTNSKVLCDSASSRPGRFSIIVDFGYLEEKQVEEVIKVHLNDKWRVPEVINLLKGTIDGKKVKVTGAFIANLSNNIHDMSEENDDWTVEDTLALIKDSYRGFYNSQITEETNKIGFKK